MDNQHQMITGYRDLSKEEIELMNRIKAMSNQVHALVLEVELHLAQQARSADEETCRRLLATVPGNWADKGKVDLQVGFMELTRAVAQPTSF